MNTSDKKEQMKIFEKKSSLSHNNEDFIFEDNTNKHTSAKDQSNIHSEIKTQKNCSPVCFAESDEIRDDYKLKPKKKGGFSEKLGNMLKEQQKLAEAKNAKK